MKKILVIGGLLLSFFLVSVSSAYAQQPQCNARDNVLESLAKKWKETTTAAGVSNTGGLVEVLTNDESGSWTIIVTTPQGMSCLVAAGEGWRYFNKKPPLGDKLRYFLP